MPIVPGGRERFSRGAVGRVLLRPEASEPGISGDSGTSPPLDDKNDPFWGAESMV